MSWSEHDPAHGMDAGRGQFIRFHTVYEIQGILLLLRSASVLYMEQCSNITKNLTRESGKVWYSAFKLTPEPAEFPFLFSTISPSSNCPAS
jgi:hypothetical protein